LPGGLEARVRLSAGPHTWILRAPVASDGTFALAGVPSGADTVTVELDDHRIAARVRDGRVEIAFPPPAAFEIVVRSPSLPGIAIYLLHGKHEVHTRKQLETLVSSGDSAIVHLHTIGFASQSSAYLTSKDSYHRNDLHAVIKQNFSGDATECMLMPPAHVPGCIPTSIDQRGGANLTLTLNPTNK
jgi:hypothetical protein